MPPRNALRPGGTISGPTLMLLADVTMYVAVLASIGWVPLAVTTNLNINFLRKGAPGLRLLFLKGDKALIRERLRARTQHFMPPGLLDSQFVSLEEPGPDESPIVIDVTPPLEVLMDRLPELVRPALSSARPGPY